eukprot:TRINITY_DN15532_c0_g1_i1.p1 TRINITY_DN15532_c0_g1~~TRINITY_DN15532_c0_g1_i1.p1  ORF type:complete len:367 (-),score=87.71 TRINITY_DN15532_c0_g1_i1:51-1073(-)
MAPIASPLSLCIAAVTALHSLSEAARTKAVNLHGALQTKKCAIEGPLGMHVTFPVERCVAECNLAATWKGMAGNILQSTKQFSLLFETKLKGRMCVCSAGGTDLVQYNVAGKARKQACSSSSNVAKMDCWTQYKKMRTRVIDVKDGRHPEVTFDLSKVSDGQFVIDRTCAPCSGDACRFFNLPSVLEDLSESERQAVAEAQTPTSSGNDNFKDFLAGLVRTDLELVRPTAHALKDQSASSDESGGFNDESSTPKSLLDDEETYSPDQVEDDGQVEQKADDETEESEDEREEVKEEAALTLLDDEDAASPNEDVEHVEFDSDSEDEEGLDVVDHGAEQKHD